MRHDVRDLLADMQQFIGELQAAVGDLTREKYDSDIVTRRAVEREFILIAEVIRRMQSVSEEVHQRIEAVRRITGFRNVLVHDYDEVDDQVIWSSITVSIPKLKQQVDAWADELGMEPPPRN